jgi:hypothetical protein
MPSPLLVPMATISGEGNRSLGRAASHDFLATAQHRLVPVA